MNYLKIYIQLIRNAQSRKLLPKNIHTEKHHIFPKSIFGTNDKILELTLREHYIAHLLLWKIYEKRYKKGLSKKGNYYKMLYSITMMSNIHKTKIKINSHLFEQIRKNAINARIGKKGSIYGKIWINKNNGKERMIIKKEELETYLELGWEKGKIDNGIWINDDNVHKKIKKEELEKYLNEGWKKGRIKPSKEAREKLSKFRKNVISINKDKEYKFIKKEDLEKYLNEGWKRGGMSISKEHKEKLINANKGKKLSKETREKISKINLGKNNPNYGKIWINKDKEYKKIKKEELEKYLELGWEKGMSKETREKMSKATLGKKRHTYGKFWINKDKQNKSIKKEELEKYLNEGWKKGICQKK